jgi:tyrosinase
MPVSRRNVLVQGSAIGAGVIAAHLSGITALAQAQPPQRRSLDDLLLNDPVIEAWREAVRQMKAKSAGDPLGWASLAAIHGTTAGFIRCPHGNWYFLPWHRGYVLMYERLTRELTGYQDFALPYWDWTRNRQLPPAFAQATVNGSPNPLFEPSRTMGPMDSLPDEIVGPSVISTIMGETTFEIFGTSRPQGQNSLDPSWITRRTGAQGTLEATPHNNVHGIVGGIMASSRSALDPIFMMHHCNIDRIWAVWRAAENPDSTEALWLGMPFQNHFFNPDGTPYSPQVSDLLSVEPLGYTYGLAGPQVSLPPSVLNLDSRLRTVFAAPGVSAAVGVRTFEASNDQQAQPTRPLEVLVQVERSLVAAVSRRPSLGAGAELLDVNRARAAAASRARAFAFIRDIAVANDQATQYRVFIDCDYLSQSTPITDDHYIGTFGFFGEHGEHEGHAEAKPSIVMDLTPAIERLYGSAPEAPDQIRVQLLPVPRGKAELDQTGTATPGRIEIAFV